MPKPYTFRPMLAATIVDSQDPADATGPYKGLLQDVTFPKIGTPKIDGIRAIMHQGVLVSRKGIPIPNYHVQSICQSVLPSGFDVELHIPGADYHIVESAIMSDNGTPNFRAMVIDWVGIAYCYNNRLNWINDEIVRNISHYYGTVESVRTKLIESMDQLLAFETDCVTRGYEGVCLRDPNGPYKFGRSTFTEQYLLKFKRMADDEATIIGFEELLHNSNEASSDVFGLTKRSSCQMGQIPMGKLGAFIVTHPKWGEFKIGTGFSNEQRQDYWNNRRLYQGSKAMFRYMPFGTKDKPRHPSFKGFRRDI